MKPHRAKVARRTTYPTFRQLCAIVRSVIEQHPADCEADLKEWIKQRHVTLGYLYSHDQIPRAMDAVERAMNRYFLTTDQQAAVRPPTPHPEQVDPPWRLIDRGLPQWTSTRDLLLKLLSKRPSDRST